MNFLFILSDDQGFWSMGCAGNRDVHTPNLDTLAENGILFDDFFCASPVCSPARASILTGTIPSRHGVQDWLAKGHIDEDQLEPSLREHIHEDKIPDERWQYRWPKTMLKGDRAVDYIGPFKCYTEFLAEAGYNCGISGKWHVGNAGVPQKGFTFWRTLAMGGENYMYPVMLNDRTNQFELLDNVYVTDKITDNAIDFLDMQSPDKPFYLSVHYNAPHAPWDEIHHLKKYFDLFDGCEFNDFPLDEPHKWTGARYDNPEQLKKSYRYRQRGYCAALAGMDDNIGRLIAHLKATGLYEDTAIIFTADNGMAMGQHGIFGKGNGTFPMNMFETSIKVPTIISMPDRKKQRADAMLSHCDIMPTILDLIGAENPAADTLPGRSFAPLLRGEPFEQDADIIITSEYGNVRMIRTRRWKYIHRYPYGEHELYDLENDPGEYNNLYGGAEYSDLTADLKSRLDKWYAKYQDPSCDARVEPVTGLGQTGRPGLASNGRCSFTGR